MSLKGGYEYERQKQNITKVVYKNVAALGGPKDADNFNSGDLWLIKKDYAAKMDRLYSKFDNISTLISEIATAFKKKEMISVSLKATQKGQPLADIIDPARELNKKSDLDFGIAKINLTYGGSEKYAFNNPEIITKSGFQIRLTHKSSGFTPLFFEGKIKGQDFQMGAVDIGKYEKRIKEAGYTMRRKANEQRDRASRQLTLEEFDKLIRVPNLFSSEQIKLLKQFKSEFERGVPDQAFNQLEHDRFIHFISAMYAIFIKVGDVKEHMKFAFNLARKVQEFSSVYIKVIG